MTQGARGREADALGILRIPDPRERIRNWRKLPGPRAPRFSRAPGPWLAGFRRGRRGDRAPGRSASARRRGRAPRGTGTGLPRLLAACPGRARVAGGSWGGDPRRRRSRGSPARCRAGDPCDRAGGRVATLGADGLSATASRRAAQRASPRTSSKAWSTAPSSSHVSVPTSRPMREWSTAVSCSTRTRVFVPATVIKGRKDAACAEADVGATMIVDSARRSPAWRMTPYRSPRSRPRTARGDRSRTTSPRCTKLVHERSDLGRLAPIVLVRSQARCLGRQRAVAAPLRRLDERLPDRL